MFIRTVGCNLRCVFAGGSICDTPYTSHDPEPPLYNDVDEASKAVLDILKANPHVHHVVITGGEPMIQQKALNEFMCNVLAEMPYTIFTMESNGTIVNRGISLDLASLSPKLSTSGCFEDSAMRVSPEMAANHHRIRVNYEAVASMRKYCKQVQLKFVYSNEDSGKEIKEWLKGFEEAGNDLSQYYILIMPEGLTDEQLKKTSPGAVQFCVENGYNFCDRVHIHVWGPARGH